MYPKGNNTNHLSVYLEVPDSSDLPNGWSRYAQFSLTMVNQVNHSKSFTKGTYIFYIVVLYIYAVLLLVSSHYMLMLLYWL